MIADLTGAGPLPGRCFACAASAREDVGDGWSRCAWCGARWSGPGYGDVARLARALRTRMHPGPRDLTGTAKEGWLLGAHSLRIAATGAGLWFEPSDGTRPGTGEDRPIGTLAPMADVAPLPVALVVLARAGDRALAAFLDRHAHGFAATVVMLDGDGGATRERDGVTTIPRPLADDFAAQRNAGTDAVRTSWAFHLDLDETIEPSFAAALPHLAARAEAAGLRAVAFPRSNLVDGAASALFPDVQYRLIRRDVRFEGRVHERPDTCGDWTRTTVSHHGAIDHHLSGARVAERRARYDAMGQHADRHADDDALLTPLA